MVLIRIGLTNTLQIFFIFFKSGYYKNDTLLLPFLSNFFELITKSSCYFSKSFLSYSFYIFIFYSSFNRFSALFFLVSLSCKNLQNFIKFSYISISLALIYSSYRLNVSSLISFLYNYLFLEFIFLCFKGFMNFIHFPSFLQ